MINYSERHYSEHCWERIPIKNINIIKSIRYMYCQMSKLMAVWQAISIAIEFIVILCKDER